MKKLLLFAFVLVAVNSFAQRIVDKEVGEFNEIKVFDLIEVNLIKADENRILIKGDHVDDIQFVNKDGVLKLRMQLEKKFQGEDTLIEVYYTDIDIIDGNEGAQIVCNETVAKDAITVKVQEGAQVKIGMDVRQLDARAVTGGIIEASGVAKNQVIVLNTGGIFEGRDLKTAYSSVKVSAGGEATLSASEKVDINVRAGGDVIVYGNPKEVNKNTLAGGRIFIKD
ncbi:head GIN domain-containing protein [Muriicola sp.]|uniref:head GIN domain-containing protein n=1 Tax=Muriicola sp. TaxID=2020856 RepID=UPI003C7942FB